MQWNHSVIVIAYLLFRDLRLPMEHSVVELCDKSLSTLAQKATQLCHERKKTNASTYCEKADFTGCRTLSMCLARNKAERRRFRHSHCSNRQARLTKTGEPGIENVHRTHQPEGGLS